MAGGIQSTSPTLCITTLGLYDTSYLPSALEHERTQETLTLFYLFIYLFI